MKRFIYYLLVKYFMKKYMFEMYRKFFGNNTSEKSKEIPDKKQSVIPFSKIKINPLKIHYEKLEFIPNLETKTEAKPLRFIKKRVLTDRLESLEQYNGKGSYEIITSDFELVNKIYETVCYNAKQEPEKTEEIEVNQRSNFRPKKIKKEFVEEKDETIPVRKHNPKKYFNEAEEKAKEINQGLLLKDIAEMIGIGYVRYSQLKNGDFIPSEELANSILLAFDRLGARIDDRALQTYKRIFLERESKYDTKFVPFESLDYWDKIVYPEDSVEKNIRAENLKLDIKRALLTLTPRESEVLTIYFGLNGEEKNLEKIGNYLNLTRERIRQIKEKAIRKLNHPSRSKNLINYL